MKLRYNYRLNPTPKQRELLKQTGGATRWLWNYFLQQNISEYATSKEYTGKGRFVFRFEMQKQLPELKKKHPWLKQVYSQTLQAVVLQLHEALKFKRHGRGFPKFKKKSDQRDSFRYVQHTKVEGKYLVLPKLGEIRIRLHRTLPKYSSVSLLQQNGNWYASFVVERQETAKPHPSQITEAIGIDVNSDLFVCSNEYFVKSPKYLKQKKDRVKLLQQRLAKKQKGSNERKKATKRLARLHQKIRNRRHDFLHQISHRIAKYGGLVCIETLKIEQMRKKKPVAKAIGDAGWGRLFQLLEYKSQLRGGYFHRINQWLASSKRCNKCPHKKEKLDLSQRIFMCDECGVSVHRDLNAALNIRDWGIGEVCHKYKIETPQGLGDVLLDVVLDVLSSDMDISASQLKAEATQISAW